MMILILIGHGMGFEFEMEKERFNQYIESGQLDQARALIREKKLVLFKEVIQRFSIRLGDAYLKKNRYEDALQCFEKAPFQTKAVKHKSASIIRILGKTHLSRGAYTTALDYYKRGNDPNIVRLISYALEGDRLFKNKQYNAALDAYQKSGFLEKIIQCRLQIGRKMVDDGEFEKAIEIYRQYDYIDRIGDCYGLMGDHFLRIQDKVKARHHYDKAVSQYDLLLKSMSHDWLDIYSKKRLMLLTKLEQLKTSEADVREKAILKEVLKGAAAYCSRLKKSSFFFYCDEYVKETIDHSIKSDSWSRRLANLMAYNRGRGSGIKTSTSIYSYQIIKTQDDIKETRKLKREFRNSGRSGRARRRVRSDEWNTTSVIFKNIIFGPVGLLAEGWQPHFTYRLIDTTTLNKKAVYILECIPKKPFNNLRDNNLFGKVWIDAVDFSIHKIEWEPKAVAFENDFLNYAKAMKRTPWVDFITRYGYLKEGIRYPSGGFYGEYFVSKRGKKEALLKIDVKYSKFKFFNVGTRTEVKKDR